MARKTRFDRMSELELLRWAGAYLTRDIAQLRGSYTTKAGRLEPPSIRREVHDLEAWVARVLELAPDFTRTTKPPAPPSDPLDAAAQLLESRLLP